jgi:hypothetical protein
LATPLKPETCSRLFLCGASHQALKALVLPVQQAPEREPLEPPGREPQVQPLEPPFLPVALRGLEPLELSLERGPPE